MSFLILIKKNFIIQKLKCSFFLGMKHHLNGQATCHYLVQALAITCMINCILAYLNLISHLISPKTT